MHCHFVGDAGIKSIEGEALQSKPNSLLSSVSGHPVDWHVPFKSRADRMQEQSQQSHAKLRQDLVNDCSYSERM
jgi:hypothetical protein